MSISANWCVVIVCALIHFFPISRPLTDKYSSTCIFYISIIILVCVGLRLLFPSYSMQLQFGLSMISWASCSIDIICFLRRCWMGCDFSVAFFQLTCWYDSSNWGLYLGQSLQHSWWWCAAESACGVCQVLFTTTVLIWRLRLKRTVNNWRRLP